MDGYKFFEFSISEHMLYSLRKYIDERQPVGHFLTAVLCNDLKEACGRADDENRRNLPAFVGYLYNEAPANCWGSPQIVKEWLEGGAS